MYFIFPLSIFIRIHLGPGIVNPSIFPPSVQQLLAAIQPHLFNHPQHESTPAISPNLPHQRDQQLTNTRRHSSQSPPVQKQIRVQTPKQSPLRISCSSNSNISNFSHNKYEKSLSSSHSTSTSISSNQQQSPANYSAQNLTNGHVPSGPSTPHAHHSHLSGAAGLSSTGGNSSSASTSSTNANNPIHHREQSPSAIAINSINRWAANRIKWY